MQKNLNRKDGIIRAVLGLGCISFFFLEFLEDGLIENIIGIAGLILIISAIIEFCPFYYFLGIKTRQKRRKKFY